MRMRGVRASVLTLQSLHSRASAVMALISSSSSFSASPPRFGLFEAALRLEGEGLFQT